MEPDEKLQLVASKRVLLCLLKLASCIENLISSIKYSYIRLCMMVLFGHLMKAYLGLVCENC